MEDRHVACTEVEGLPGHSFFGVFDGHGGDEAAIMSAEDPARGLLPLIRASKAMGSYVQGGCSDPQLLGEAMVQGFVQCDAVMRPQISRSGTTAVTCFVTPTHFICANAGDSRGVYCKAAGDAGGGAPAVPCLQGVHGDEGGSCEHSPCIKAAIKALGVDSSRCLEKQDLLDLFITASGGAGGGGVVALSEDHKPQDPIEHDRITRAGGTVTQGGFGGPMRVDGSLAVSRALGVSMKSTNFGKNSNILVCVGLNSGCFDAGLHIQGCSARTRGSEGVTSP